MGVLCILLSYSLSADNKKTTDKVVTDANIVGHVKDKKTGEHLSDVAVMIKGTTVGVITDASGHYFLKNLPAGEIRLVTSSFGYAPIEKNVTLETGKTIEVNFEIEEEALSINGTVVSASRNETSRKTAPNIVTILR